MASQISSGAATPDPIRQELCDGLILAGGSGRRLGMGPKHAVRVRGRTMLAHTQRAIAPQVHRLWLNLPPAVVDEAAAPIPIHLADAEGFVGQGPLAGLLAGLTHCQNDFLLCVPIDAIRPPPDLAQRLLTSLQDQKADVAVAGGQYTCLLARCAAEHGLTKTLRDYLHTGARSVRGWLEQQDNCRVDWPDDAGWIWSLNTPQELAAANQAMTR